MASDGWLSVTARQRRPAFSVSHTPPPAEPASTRLEFAGSTASEEIRPEPDGNVSCPSVSSAHQRVCPCANPNGPSGRHPRPTAAPVGRGGGGAPVVPANPGDGGVSSPCSSSQLTMRSNHLP